MSGEGAVLSNSPAEPARAAADAGADGGLIPVRSGSLLRRIARRLLPHPAAVPVVVALASQQFTDEQLREIDRRIVAALRITRTSLLRELGDERRRRIGS